MPFMSLGGRKRVVPTQGGGGGGTLVFTDPGTQNYAIDTSNSLNLSSYVSGGEGTNRYHKASGSIPKDMSLAPTTGVLSGTTREAGSVTASLVVTDNLVSALEEDWQARLNAPGVRWGHDFRDPTEVSKFLVGPIQLDEYGVNCTRHITSDYITGSGCLELYTPANAHNNMVWARPFSAFPGDVGYTSGPAYPSDYPTNWFKYRRGCYGHPDYWVDNPSANDYGGISWDGHDFYMQFRTKISASCFDAANQAIQLTGKFALIDICSGSNQEITIQQPYYGGDLFNLYTNFGSRSNSSLDGGQGQGTPGQFSAQPGGVYANTCFYNTYSDCWRWPVDEWVTLLMHVTPGHHNGNSNQPDMASTSNWKDHGIEVWIARYGDTEYTKIWEKMDYVWNYDAQTGYAGNPYGFNVMEVMQYMNNVLSPTAWYRRIGQVIFSQKFIECPRVYA